MTIPSTAGLLGLLRQHHLLEPERLQELEQGQSHYAEPSALARELVKRNWLTTYQINQIFQGRAAALVLGSYVLLERLGEGGMGTVYKACHRRMNRIVALKALRAERVSNPDAVRRFHREIQVAARLSHPNVVIAYDADEAGNVHFFTMEYVEGRDLARLVRAEGPLDVARACDYACQAAQGLQHAHEQGLVHRDVKPHNLLLSTKGVVKVLDLGLARLAVEAEAATVTASLTQEGVVMGTPDFMAPEQSLSTHKADVRADLYGLGCTLYFLLTGKVPFPGGTLGDKIARHLAEQPRPLQQFRPEVPAAVAAVVAKLMAKKPEDRYTTPAETAQALLHAVQGGQPRLAETVSESTEFDLPASAPPSTASARLMRKPSRRWLWMILAAVLLVSAGIGTLVLLTIGRSPRAETPADQPVPVNQEPKPQRILAGHTAAIGCLTFSQAGNKLASADNGGTVRVWNPANGEVVMERKTHRQAVRALAFAFDGMLASGGEDGRIVVCNAATLADERSIPLDNNRPVRGLSFAPGIHALFAVSADKTLTGWDPANGEVLGYRGEDFFPDGDAAPCSLAFAPDRNYWWAIGLVDGRVLLWNHDVKDQHELKGHVKPVRALAFSRDGKLLATGGEDGIVQLWDVATGELRGTLADNLGAIHSVAISSDGRLLAAVGAASIVHLWDLGSRRIRSSLRLDVGDLNGVVFSPDNETLASCGNDRKIRLWSVADFLKLSANR